MFAVMPFIVLELCKWNSKAEKQSDLDLQH